jgi:hypothetical protein
MKTTVYTDARTGDLISLLNDDLNDHSDQELNLLRNRDLRHALSRIAQAKRQGHQEVAFKHNHSTMRAVHVALRQLGYLPRKHSTDVSMVSWGDPT